MYRRGYERGGSKIMAKTSRGNGRAGGVHCARVKNQRRDGATGHAHIGSLALALTPGGNLSWKGINWKKGAA